MKRVTRRSLLSSLILNSVFAVLYNRKNAVVCLFVPKRTTRSCILHCISVKLVWNFDLNRSDLEITPSTCAG